jgi:hypothetical protein
VTEKNGARPPLRQQQGTFSSRLFQLFHPSVPPANPWNLNNSCGGTRNNRNCALPGARSFHAQPTESTIVAPQSPAHFLDWVMPPPPEIVHALRRTDDPKVELSSLDTLALERLMSSNPADVVAYAQSLAAALSGPDADGVRLRTLARSIAVARAQQALLEGMLMERLAKRDPDVELIDKALRGVAARLVKFVEAHRQESATGRRPTVVVGHADTVNVEGGG